MALIMNTAEIESALVNFEMNYPTLCQRVALPEKTHEGRSCHALRIAKNREPGLEILVAAAIGIRSSAGDDRVFDRRVALQRDWNTPNVAARFDQRVIEKKLWSWLEHDGLSVVMRPAFRVNRSDAIGSSRRR